MAKIGLVNPSSKRKNYQGLAPLSAVMPPHWLAVRASYLRSQGDTVIVHDCAISELKPERFATRDRIEIMPSGVHPHAFIHEQAGVESATELLSPLEIPIEVVMKLDFNPSPYSPAWDYFNLDDYYCHNWHGWGRESRNPYGTLATSVSCPYNCSFCNIREYYSCKYERRSKELIQSELDTLYMRGVRNIKMMDEIFLLNIRNTLEFLSIAREYSDLNIWGYSRLDSVNIGIIRRLKEAGINWICLGIESGNAGIRQKTGKGNLDNGYIKSIVKAFKDNGIAVLGNFMFGFPADDMDTMKQTMDLAVELNCEYSNFYCMVGYPSTGMEVYAKEQGWELPSSYSAYSQYAYDFQPLPTHNLTAAQVLAFRDKSWQEYHTNPDYLSMIERKFGESTRTEIENMTKITLKRKLFSDADNV